MRLLLVLIGTMFFVPSVEALTAPRTPFTISAYPQEVFSHVDTYLSGVSGGGGGETCNVVDSRARAASNLRDILFDLEGAVIAPQRDLARSACFQNDIVEMERYLRALIDSALSSAEDCDGQAQVHYETMVVYVWNRLRDIRRFGLRPWEQAPAEGTGTVSVGTGPSTQLCPYESTYAAAGPGGVGCSGIVASTVSAGPLKREVNLFESIIARLGEIGTVELPALRKQLIRIWKGAERFVSGAKRTRPLGPSVFLDFEPDLSEEVTVPAAGEAGCLDWPSSITSGRVTGEGIPLQSYFPFILTNELADALTFIEMRDDPRWFEYEQALRQEFRKGGGGELTLTAQGGDLRDVNRDHLYLETFSILSIRETQSQMNDLANALHASTRSFVRQAVVLPGDSDSPNPAPLRTFAANYARFLSRMCVNKGCQKTLLRTIELSLRDECFKSFLMGAFFQANPSASTLPACKALYVD